MQVNVKYISSEYITEENVADTLKDLNGNYSTGFGERN